MFVQIQSGNVLSNIINLIFLGYMIHYLFVNNPTVRDKILEILKYINKLLENFIQKYNKNDIEDEQINLEPPAKQYKEEEQKPIPQPSSLYDDMMNNTIEPTRENIFI